MSASNESSPDGNARRGFLAWLYWLGAILATYAGSFVLPLLVVDDLVLPHFVEDFLEWFYWPLIRLVFPVC